MPEYLEVLFPQRRIVLINGVSMGETNMLLELEGGKYVVKLGQPQDFTPAQQQIDLRDTSALTPMQVEFKEI
jgi:PEGA domain